MPDKIVKLRFLQDHEEPCIDENKKEFIHKTKKGEIVTFNVKNHEPYILGGKAEYAEDLSTVKVRIISDIVGALPKGTNIEVPQKYLEGYLKSRHVELVAPDKKAKETPSEYLRFLKKTYCSYPPEQCDGISFGETWKKWDVLRTEYVRDRSEHPPEYYVEKGNAVWCDKYGRKPGIHRGKHVKILKPVFIDISNKDRPHTIMTYRPGDIKKVMEVASLGGPPTRDAQRFIDDGDAVWCDEKGNEQKENTEGEEGRVKFIKTAYPYVYREDGCKIKEITVGEFFRADDFEEITSFHVEGSLDSGVVVWCNKNGERIEDAKNVGYIWFYHLQGFSIIPLGKNKGFWNNNEDELKKPSLKSWDKYKTTPATKEQIQEWIDDGLFKNIGIVLGRVSNNLVIFDLDDETILEILGLKAEKILKSGSWLAKTGKGYQIWLRHHGDPGGIKKPLKYKIEYRANRGYCVVPPSKHPNGRLYHFIGIKNFPELPTLIEKDAKAIFEDFKKKIQKAWGIKKDEKYIPKTKTTGKSDYPECVNIALNTITKHPMRFYTIYGLASSFYFLGIPLDMAMQRIKRFNLEKCVPSHSRDIVEQAVNGSYQPESHRWGCEFWRDDAEVCPFEDMTECPFGKKKIKRELLEKYEVFETKEDKKTGEIIKTGKINCIRLADVILNEHDYHFFTMRDNKSIFFYNKGFYEPKGDTIISNLVEYYLDDQSREYMKNEVIGHIRDKNYVDRETINPDVNLINLENGVYDIKTRKLLPHSPKYRFLNKIPIKYDPDAKCPQFKRFLQEVCMKQKKRREDIEKTLQEYMGYTLYRSYPFKRYTVLDGTGDNGKTVLLNVVERLIGKQNNASVSLQDLNNRPFALEKLYGKLGNISDDLPNRPLRYTGIIKQITGNSPMWADIKNHKDGIRFTNTAKPWFGCNQLPESYDWTDAFFSRMLQITFLNKFVQPPDYDKINDETVFKADTDLTEGKCKLFDELSGILNYAREGLHRLLKNKRFSFQQSTDEVREDYIKKTNPIHAFIDDECERTNEDWGVTKDDFYNAVLDYCELHGYDKPNSQHDVTRRVNDEPGNIYLKQRTADGELQRVWVGVRSLTDSTINQYFGRDKGIIKKQEGEFQETLDKKGDQDDKRDDKPIFTETEEVDIKQIIQENKEDNYTLLTDKYGTDKINKAIDISFFTEHILGKKLEFAGISSKNDEKTAKKADNLNENGG